MSRAAVWALGADLDQDPEAQPSMSVPETDAELAETFERIFKARSDLVNLDQYEADRIALIQERCADERKKIEARIAFWEGSALAYCDQVKTRVRLPDLNISVEAQPAKGLEWTDEAALKAWAVRNDFLNAPKPPDPGPDKKRIKEHWETTGEIPEGARAKDGLRLDVRKIGK